MSSALASAPAQSGTALPSAAPPPAASAFRLIASDIKLAHSVFAMPFAVLGAFMARRGGEPWSRFAGQLLLVVACMVLARTWAMVFNRLADARYDAANPRTSRRVFAAGVLRLRTGWMAAGVSAALFSAACGLFWVFFGNRWPMILAVPVLAWIAFYSLTKRFTWACHFFLGSALAASPAAAALAVRPEALTETPAIWCLAGMVLFWVAGFDVVYALQDVDFDRSAGLRSAPADLGVGPAITLSRLCHVIALAFLIAALRLDPRFGVIFGVGVGMVGVLLIAEHVVLARRGRAGLEMAFFTLNGVVSCVLGVAGCLDLALAL